MSNTETLLATSMNEAYPVFEPNQLLTSSHLNQLRNYLDNQDRVTRVKLVGIGITCGLELSYSKHKITISEGVGITSHGFLIRMEEETFSKCAEAVYADPENYPFFIDKVDSVTGQIPMWELLPDKSKVSPAINFASPDFSSFLEDKVVVLFMEYEDIDLENCVGQNCDDKGITRQFTIRKLLIRCEDVDKIIRMGYKIPKGTSLDDALNVRFKVNFMAMPAFSLLPDKLPLKDYPAYYHSYRTADQIYKRYAALFPDSAYNPLFVLGKKIVQAYGYFKPFLQFSIPAADISNLTDWFKKQLIEYYQMGHIQYFYDYAKDLVKAYNEFVFKAFELTADCCPDKGLFPRHLVIGKVTKGVGCPENEDTCKPKVYRTHFIQSPIYNQQKDKIKEVQNDFARLVLMIRGLQRDYSLDQPLKVTPSNEKQAELSLWSIPFYYNVKPLYRFWNYELTKRCRADWNLSYWSDQFENKIPSSLFPLQFNLDPYNFYRIEGLLGKSNLKVCAQLEVLKRKHHLDFDILPIKMRESSILDIIKLRQFKRKNNAENLCNSLDCGMTDLKENYLQLRNEIINEYKELNDLLVELLKIVFNLKAQVQLYSAEGKKLAAKKDTGLEAQLGLSKLLGGTLPQIKDVMDALPMCLDDFNPIVFRDKFQKLTLVMLIMVILMERMLRKTSIFGVFIEYYFDRLLIGNGVFRQFSDIYNFFENGIDVRVGSIYFSYLQRLKALDNAHLFGNFAKNNPGLEHMAGVPKGGTFIIVYGEDELPDGGAKEGAKDKKLGYDRVIADFALPGKVCCTDPFPFCKEDKPVYSPIAKNIYLFLDPGYEPGEAVYIDIRNRVVDLNVKDIALADYPEGALSQLGCPVGLITNDRGLSAISYAPNAAVKGSFDKFDYKIHHKDDPSNASVGTVYITTMVGLAPPTKDSTNQKTVPTGETITTGGDYIPENETKAPDKAFTGTDFLVELAPETSVTKDLADETKKRFETINSMGDLEADASAEDVQVYEGNVVNEIKDVMKDTSERIKAIEMQLEGEPEDDLVDKLEFRLEFEEKFAERDALISLYHKQSEKLVEVVEEKSLAKDKEGEMYKFIDTDFRANTEKIGKHNLEVKEAFLKSGEKEGVDNTTKELFKSFELRT